MSDLKISDLEAQGRMEELQDEALATFAKEAAPLIAVRRAPLGHLLVHPRVNGRDVGWFVLDSGAGSSTIVPGVAEELGLEIVQQVEAMSVKGMISTPVRRAESLELGAITLRNIKLVDFELASWGFGEAIAGIVGSELFKRAVVEVELAEDVIGIHDPSSYVLEAGNWEGLALRFGHPHVRARFEGGGDREGLFKIDLGATVNESPVGNVIFHAPTVRELGLLEGRETRQESACGLELAMGTIDWFELAGHRFDSPDVAFAVVDSGCFSDEKVTGNLGGRFLEPFRVVFDYSNERVAFIPRVRGQGGQDS